MGYFGSNKQRNGKGMNGLATSGFASKRIRGGGGDGPVVIENGEVRHIIKKRAFIFVQNGLFR